MHHIIIAHNDLNTANNSDGRFYRRWPDFSKSLVTVDQTLLLLNYEAADQIAQPKVSVKSQLLTADSEFNLLILFLVLEVMHT